MSNYCRGPTGPTGPTGTGPTGSSTPLARLRWIDGNTLVLPINQNGSESAPYDSPERWLGTLTAAPVSSDDALTYEVGLTAPTAADVWSPNPQTLTIPANRQIMLQGYAAGDPNAGAPFLTNPVINWAQANAAFGLAFSHLDFVNFPMDGFALTLTDTPLSPFAELTFVGLGDIGTYLGTLNYAAMNNADGLLVDGATLRLTSLTAPASSALCFSLALENNGEIQLLGASTWFDVLVYNGLLTTVGGQTVTSLNQQSYTNAQILAGALTSTNGPLEFVSTMFGEACVITSPAAQFDGTSWASFLNAGGTWGATVAQVSGGFNSGIVPGANIATPAGNACALSLNGSGATAGFTQGGNWYEATALTPSVVTTVTLQGGGGIGDTLCITRTDAGTGTLIIKDAGGATLGILTGVGFLLARFDGAAFHYVEAKGDIFNNPTVNGLTTWEPTVLAPATASYVQSELFTGETTAGAHTAVVIGPNVPLPGSLGGDSGFPTPPVNGVLRFNFEVDITGTTTAVGATLTGVWGWAVNGAVVNAFGAAATPLLSIGSNGGAPPAGWSATIQFVADAHNGQAQVVVTTDAADTYIVTATFRPSYTE